MHRPMSCDILYSLSLDSLSDTVGTIRVMILCQRNAFFITIFTNREVIKLKLIRRTEDLLCIGPRNAVPSSSYCKCGSGWTREYKPSGEGSFAHGSLVCSGEPAELRGGEGASSGCTLTASVPVIYHECRSDNT